MVDIRFTAEELAFRDEVSAFVATNLPDRIRERMLRHAHLERDDVVTWHRILHARGWAVTNWPVEWGGTDWSPTKRYIFRERLQAAPAPEPLTYNVNMIGPVLIRYGTDAQKSRFLARAARLDDWWAQGFSEPGAGSDLASLRTTARRDGEHYVVTGQKIWTSQATDADWVFCLVRTYPAAARKQQGISFLLIDLRSPGITIRPIRTIDNANYVNEVFFDEVRVPAENLVGRENEGWSVAKVLLGNERAGIARIGLTRARIERARAVAAITPDGKGFLIDDQHFRQRLQLLTVDLQALELTQLRLLSRGIGGGEGEGGGERPDPITSVLKLRGTQLQQEAAQLLLEATGTAAAVSGPDEAGSNAEDMAWPPPEAQGVIPTYFFARASSIYGGSNEIQRNILAASILGR